MINTYCCDYRNMFLQTNRYYTLSLNRFGALKFSDLTSVFTVMPLAFLVFFADQ